MIRPSKTRSDPIVLTSKLGVEYCMSYVGHFRHSGTFRQSGKAYANVANVDLKQGRPTPDDPLGQLNWYPVDTHSRYARYLNTEPL